MEKITMEEALSRGLYIYTHCPKCKKEIRVKKENLGKSSFSAECKNCNVIFGYDLAKEEK